MEKKLGHDTLVVVNQEEKHVDKMLQLTFHIGS